MNYYNSDKYEDDLQIWRKSDSWYKLCHLMTLFIDTKIPSPHYFGHIGQYNYENSRLCNKLRTLNNNGFLTVNSQPGGLEDCEIKRGYLDLYIPITNLDEVLQSLKSYNLFILITVINDSCKQFLKDSYKDYIYMEYKRKK